MKKTKWFPGSQKPELPGVYERDYGMGLIFFAYFNGYSWGQWGESSRDADYNRVRISGFGNVLPWRGLAEKP